MTTTTRKKLIEVALPLEAINKASAREKSIRHGHPSTLHLWWARRPLAACRAVLFGQLVDDPSAWPERFTTEEEQEAERQRLFRIIEQLVQWENSTNEQVLNAARWEIARSVAWGLGEEPPRHGDGKAILAYLQDKAPPVYDPFCGGGSIPLEAQRLGLRAYGSDLNPVAVLISKALVEIPPKFAGLAPVNPESRKKLNGAGSWTGKGAQGLAEDVRFYGKWMRDEAEKRIGYLYPQVEVTAEAVRQQPGLKPLKGQKLTVIAWLWARTVASPNPAANGAQVPLVSSFMLSTKEGKKAWVVPVTDPDAPHGYRFEVRSGKLSKAEEEKTKAGTKSSVGADFTCVLTATPIKTAYIKGEGREGRMGARLMAIVAEGERGRVYLPPTADHERVAESAAPAWEPEGELFTGALGFRVPAYGFREWRQLYTRRQLVALTTFTDLVAEAREQALADSRVAGCPSGPRLADGGIGAEAYADAVATYLGFAISRLADRHSSLTRWDPNPTGYAPKIANTFSRQALPMVWDHTEGNPFSPSTAMAGKVRLLKRVEMPAPWQPSDDKTPTVWECTQHLIRTLEADGESPAGALLARLGSRADPTRDLAYRLYQICERKKWAEEARAYNGLVVAWPELQKLAAQRAAPEAELPAQGELL
jgi:putative DNA methylase